MLLIRRLVIGHLNIRGFINFSVINVGYFIDIYNDRVIPRTIWVVHNGTSNLLKLGSILNL